MTPGQRSSATVKKPVYALSFAEGVRHQLERLPGHLYQRAKRIIEELKIDPRPHYAEPLRGRSERYKIVLGTYRIVYRVGEDILLVLVLKVGKKHGPEFYADIEDLEE
jgi:mRNA interferase RelE/StbE